jgi:membrane protease YdiL (CAAX protease family)
MPYLNFNSAKPLIKLFITFLAIISIGVIVYIIGILFSRLVFSLHLDDVNHLIYGRFEELTDWQLKFYQFFQTFGFFVIPGIFLFWIFSTPKENFFNVSLHFNSKAVIFTVVAFLACFPFINWLVNLNESLHLPKILNNFEIQLRNSDQSLNSLSGRLTESDNPFELLVTLVIIAILPSIGEEFIFRGVFQRIFNELTRNIHVSVLLTAVLFSSFHGEFFSFIPRLFLGIFLGYLMVWGKSIWLPVIGHFIFNSMGIIISYLYQHGFITISPSELGIDGTFGFTVIISIGLIIISTIIIQRSSLQRNEPV